MRCPSSWRIYSRPSLLRSVEAPGSQSRANPERNFQMAEAKWPVCQEEAKANVRRPWPFADDAADRPLRPGRLPSTSERIAWERAGAARGLWLCCVGRPSPMGIGLPPRLVRDPSALPPFRKFLSGFALKERIRFTRRGRRAPGLERASIGAKPLLLVSARFALNLASRARRALC